MPYITQLQGATLTAGADAPPVLALPETGLLNSFGPSREFTGYNKLDDSTPGTTAPGEFIAPVINGEPLNGTFQGNTTFSNAATTIGSVTNGGIGNLATGVRIQINPINGQIFEDSNGNVYLISEQPIDASRLGVTLTTKLAGFNATTTTVPLNEVGSNLGTLGSLVTPILGPTEGLTQTLLNGAVTTFPAPSGSFTPPANQVLDNVPCFAAGTKIMTGEGYRLVEDLKTGDAVSTKDNGDKPLLWVGSRKLNAADLEKYPNLRPIRIRAGALGNGVPISDLIVSPQHRVLVRSKIAARMFDAKEVLVPAKQLMCLEGIDIAYDLIEVEYFHFLFDQHEVVVSNGAETESLYTGPQALKSVGASAQEEIFAIFPELAEKDYQPVPARILASGRMGRRLAVRHLQNRVELVQ